ncbi:DUF4383 domain-containing protein [Phormidium tenue FACHB-886]|nr:DUF4383 domain-containing protein [Phormidium tenue FACHB-886]
MQTAADAIKIRFCALGLGVMFLLIGLAGFVPSFVASPPDLSLVYAHGYLFGIFPTNHFHNAIHVLVGLWGIAAYTSLGGSITFNKVFAVLYIGLAVLGLFPYTNTLFSTMPIYGNNVWFNLLTAVIAFYYGFVKSAPFESGIGRVNSI